MEFYKEKGESMDDMFKAMQAPEGLAMEAASFNVNASARNLAKLAAFMANKGTLDGKQLLSEDGWNKLHGEPKEGLMNHVMETKFT